METVRHCWCGNSNLVDFSSEYLLCPACTTLVSQAGLQDDQALVHDDEQDFYGRNYWLTHQTEHYNLPDIFQRIQSDLPERCLHWLKTLLKYKTPTAKILELGSAHGGFVAMMNWAGYKATGLEMSPWVVEFARKTFDIPMLLGPIENQSVEPGSLDVIALFDVLEHLTNPFRTMQHCSSLLKEDGFFLVQIPNYKGDKSFVEMVEQEDIFLEQMKGIEHLHLFSVRAAQELFGRIGFQHLQFEQAIFPYDMYFVASRAPLPQYTSEQVSRALQQSATARLVKALLDKSSELNEYTSRFCELQSIYYAAESDRAERLKVIERQGQELSVACTERDHNGMLLKSVQEQLQISEQDRVERLKVIEQQGQELAKVYAENHKHLTLLQEKQVDLHQTQQELDRTRNQFQQTQQELDRTRNQFQQIQGQLQQIKSQFIQSQLQLQQVQQVQQKLINHQNYLQQLKEQFWQTQAALHEAQTELSDVRGRMEAMETSKFWKLRTAWFRIKKRLGLPGE